MSGTDPATRGHAVIELSGELDIADATALGAALSAAVARTPQIEVDLVPRRPWDSATQPFWVMRWVV